MRFYVTQMGEPSGEGLDFPDTDTVMIQTAEAALGIARDQLTASAATNVSLEVRSDQGPVGRVTVSVVFDRT